MRVHRLFCENTDKSPQKDDDSTHLFSRIGNSDVSICWYQPLIQIEGDHNVNQH